MSPTAEAVLPYVCPYDHDPLARDGATYACGRCGKSFPIRDGIPDFLAHELDSLSEEHRQVRDEWIQDDEHDYGDPYRNEVEIPHFLAKLDARDGDLILDAACGKGRIALRLLRDRRVGLVGLDYSLPALFGFRHRAPAGSRLQLAKADMAHMPFPDRTFDRIMAIGLLPNVPSDEAADQIVKGLARLLKPGGTAILSVMNYSWSAQRLGYPKAGYFPNTNVFIRYYTPDEFAARLSPHFQVRRIAPICAVVPKVSGAFLRLGGAGLKASHLFDLGFRHLPAARRYANVLVAECTPKS
jgi:SAM-dependent methyltransferase